MKITILIIFLLSFFFLGCKTVHKGAKEVGKPLGKTMKAVGGVSEGALEGYSDQEQEDENPYNR
jgi:hypothetical protein